MFPVIAQFNNVPPKWQRRRTVPATTTDRRSTLFFLAADAAFFIYIHFCVKAAQGSGINKTWGLGNGHLGVNSNLLLKGMA